MQMLARPKVQSYQYRFAGSIRWNRNPLRASPHRTGAGNPPAPDRKLSPITIE
jgi:hypothetical protein